MQMQSRSCLSLMGLIIRHVSDIKARNKLECNSVCKAKEKYIQIVFESSVEHIV